jgi:hypothetical protein
MRRPRELAIPSIAVYEIESIADAKNPLPELIRAVHYLKGARASCHRNAARGIASHRSYSPQSA